MNILEAFIKKYGQIIILILGLPCTNKSAIAKELNIDLNIPILKINDFLLKDKYTEKIIDDIKFKLYEESENYDWKKLNNEVNNLKKNGLIIYGNYIDITKIDWDINFSFFYSMNNNLCKKILIEKKLISSNYSDKELKIYFDKIFNPIYEEVKNSIKINKFFNIKEDTNFDDSYDEVFNLLMDLISKQLI
jgi:hypothetical protein